MTSIPVVLMLAALLLLPEQIFQRSHASHPLQDALRQEQFLRDKYNISLVVDTPALLSFTQLQASDQQG
jgi:hypothetical protein